MKSPYSDYWKILKILKNLHKLNIIVGKTKYNKTKNLKEDSLMKEDMICKVYKKYSIYEMNAKI